MFALKINISNVKLVLSFLVLMEELRDLSLPEWNFKLLLEQKLQSLLRQQRAYWKQRGQIKWVTLGDASTKFFHAHATMHYRKNLITSLEDENSASVYDHSNKENLIWTAFKERLGVSSFSEICFNLEHLLDNSTDLTHLCTIFQNKK